jgi:hypothetical protein
MVAPADGAKRIKWRHHCSTCGVLYERPRKWAYCSKKCERERVGFEEPSPIRDVGHYLDLAVRLESAAPWERADLIAQMRALEVHPVVADVAPVPVGTPAPSPESADYWVAPLLQQYAKLEQSMRRSVALAIRLGRRLVEARERLPHGEFGRLFRDHETPVDGAVPFSRSWAFRLMAIASHEVVANVAHAQQLPPDLTALYALSRLPVDELRQAIEAGRVHADMRRNDALALLPREDMPEDELLERLVARLRSTVERFCVEHPELAPAVLARVPRELEFTRKELRS